MEVVSSPASTSVEDTFQEVEKQGLVLIFEQVPLLMERRVPAMGR